MNVDLIIQGQEVALLAMRLALIGKLAPSAIEEALADARQTLKRGEDALRAI